MSIEEAIPTEEALQGMDTLLSRVDLDEADQLPDDVFLEVLLHSRKIAQRTEALAMGLTAKAERRRASDRALGTPLTSTIANAEGLDDKAAAREVFSARDVTKHRKVHEATLAGEVSIDHARGISKGMRQLSPLLKPPQLEYAEQLFLERAKTTTPNELPKQADQVLALVAPELALTPGR